MANISRKTKWLRIVTSIGALYLDSCLHGAVVPIVSEWKWAATDVPLITSTELQSRGETRPSLVIGAIFLSTGVVELGLSPVFGVTADRFGFDVVVLAGLLIGILKCLLFGLIGTSIAIVLIDRVLQGVVGACTQTIAIARIRDVYTKASPECANMIAIAMCKVAFTSFGGLFIGELYRYLKYRVFLLFLPISLLLVIGLLITFRTDNFHSSKDESNEKDECEQKSSPSIRWRVICDVQLMIVSICFILASLGQSSLEPSIAVWMKSAFGAGPESTGVILALCGVASIIGSLASAQVLPTLQHRAWIFCMASVCVTGVPLLLVNFSTSIYLAGAALFSHFMGSAAARFTLLLMCSTIANSRYPQAYGLVFAVLNMGCAVSFLLGPLLSPNLFGSVCVICVIGAACTASSLLTVILQNLDSTQGPNIMDCFPEASPKYQIVTNEGPLLPYEKVIQQPKN